MKITKEALKLIIKEELTRVLQENTGARVCMHCKSQPKPHPTIPGLHALEPVDANGKSAAYSKKPPAGWVCPKGMCPVRDGAKK